MDKCNPPHVFCDSRIVVPGLHGRPAACHVTGICRGSDRPRLVVLAELPDNPGASVTNLAEVFAWYATFWFCPDDGCNLWVEHYPRRGARGETFDLIEFSRRRAWQREDMLGRARWHPTTRGNLDAMLGTPLAGFIPAQPSVGSGRKGR